MESRGLRCRPEGPRGRDTDDLSVFEKMALYMQDVSGDRGVLKEVIRPGSGENVVPDSTVIVKFSGYLEHSDKPFDTNWFHRNPRLMKLGEDITLLGMEVSVLTMQRGELSRFLYSPFYAYGNLGCPPLIPPSSTVMFEIELLDFLDTAESDTFFGLSPHHQSTFPLEKVIEIAATERKFGNYLFKRNRFFDAKDRYKRAASYLSRSAKSEEESRQLDAARLPVNLNLALAYMKLERPSRSLQWGEKALAINNTNVKGLFRCGQGNFATKESIEGLLPENYGHINKPGTPRKLEACLELREYEKAREYLLRAQRVEPFNAEINSELRRLSSYYKVHMDQQREFCLRMFAPKSSKAV